MSDDDWCMDVTEDYGAMGVEGFSIQVSAPRTLGKAVDVHIADDHNERMRFQLSHAEVERLIDRLRAIAAATGEK